MIYIAAPYSDSDQTVVDNRVKRVCEYSGGLLKNGQSCVSALTVGVSILQHTNLPTDFSFCKKLSFDLIDVCDEIHVLMLDGWDNSIGVDGEVNYGIKKGIKIKHINI